MHHAITGIFVIILFLAVNYEAKADEDSTRTPNPLISKSPVTLFGNFRSYGMGTVNSGNLTDFYSWANGIKLGAVTKRYKGFSLGGVYYVTVNMGLGNEREQDPVTGRGSRYEIALYDFNRRNQDVIPVFGQIYADYSLKGHYFKAGRMEYRSPLINPADGRMVPTLIQGAVYENRSFENWHFDLLYIDRFLPRATSSFYTIQNSFQHSPGINTFGKTSEYQGNIKSQFILAGAVQLQLDSTAYVKVWNYYADNIFNSLYSEGGTVLTENNQYKLEVNIQHLFQAKVNNGGHENPMYRYFEDDYSNMIGARLKLYRNNSSLSLNFNHITDQGRFVFPRAWGRDPSFTFLRRERSEGMGNYSAVMAKFEQDVTFKDGSFLNIRVGHGYYKRPDPLSSRFNKYGIPSNSQTNIGLLYDFAGSLSGLRAEAIVVHKGNLDDDVVQNEYIFNKVDLLNYQVVVNYAF